MSRITAGSARGCADLGDDTLDAVLALQGDAAVRVLLLTGAGMAWVLGFWDTQLLAQNLVAGVDSFPLLAVPFFILAGELMNSGGISRRIIDMAQAWVGHIRGGLGFVAIGAAVLMASMSGSALADTAALATILLLREKPHGYRTAAALQLAEGQQLRALPAAHVQDALAGHPAYEVTGGEVLFEGRRLGTSGPRGAIRRGLGLAPEDRMAIVAFDVVFLALPTFVVLVASFGTPAPHSRIGGTISPSSNTDRPSGPIPSPPMSMPRTVSRSRMPLA